MVLTSAAQWAGMGLDQAGSDRTHSVLACVWEPERATGIREAFWGICIVLTVSAMNLVTPYLMSKHFQAPRFQRIQVYLAVGNLNTVGK